MDLKYFLALIQKLPGSFGDGHLRYHWTGAPRTVVVHQVSNSFQVGLFDSSYPHWHVLLFNPEKVQQPGTTFTWVGKIHALLGSPNSTATSPRSSFHGSRYQQHHHRTETFHCILLLKFGLESLDLDSGHLPVRNQIHFKRGTGSPRSSTCKSVSQRNGKILLIYITSVRSVFRFWNSDWKDNVERGS